MAGRDGIDIDPLGHDWLDDLLMIHEIEQEEYRENQPGFSDDDFEELLGL